MSSLAPYRQRLHQRFAEARARARGSRGVSEAKSSNARWFDDVDPRTADPGGGVIR
jgi:hypothetical protein